MKHHFLIWISFLLAIPGIVQTQTSFRSFEVETADKAFLGIRSEYISKEKAIALGFENYFGSYVTKVIPNTAAERSGIRPFDYIYGINDKVTSKSQRLGDLLWEFEPGDRAKIHLIRNGRSQTLQIVFGTRDEADYTEAKEERAFLGIAQTYNSQGPDAPVGVTVNIVNNSSAEAMGLRNGDLITHVNGNRIIDWTDVTTAISNTSPGENIRVDYWRSGKAGTASGQIKSNSEPAAAPRQDEWTSKSYNSVRSYAFLGINSEKVSGDKAALLGLENPYGSYVSNVISNTAASRAGVKPFDYIYGVDEYRVGDNQSLSGILKKYQPGDKAQLHIMRQGKKITLPVVFGDRDQITAPKEKNYCQDPFLGVIEVANRNSNDESGVVVNVVKNSSAESIGLENNDKIIAINGNPIFDWTDIGIAIDNMTPGETIRVKVEREGRTQTLSGAIQSYAATKNCEDCDCDDFKGEDNYAFDFDFDFNQEEREDSDYDQFIEIEDIDPQEFRTFEQKGTANIPDINNLQIESLSVYYNKENASVKLKFELPQSGETSISLFNASGRPIYEYDLGRFSGSFSDQLNLYGNNSGNFYLVIRQDGKTLSKRIRLD
jgi:S1-C subfamily serine protease